MTEKRIAVLHHMDEDGFGAAFAAWYGVSLMLPPDQIRPNLKLFPVQYGQPVPEELEGFAPHEVYILDFSYDRGTLLGLNEKYPMLVVVDHHKTAEEELKDLPFCLFDTERSGCALAWHLFNKDLAMPAILSYVEDRDLWKFELPESKAVNAYISTLPWDFMEWLGFGIEIAVQAGYAVLAFQGKQIEKRVKAAGMVNFPATILDLATLDVNRECGAGINQVNYFAVPIVNASDNISELGDALAKAYPEAPFSVSYCDRPDGKRSYSLRSRNGFDVSVVAKAFGGGGHPGAAGFVLDAPSIF